MKIKRGSQPPEPHIHPGSSDVPCGDSCISLRKLIRWDDITIIQMFREPLLYDPASNTHGDPKPNSAEGIPPDQASGDLLFEIRNSLLLGDNDEAWFPAGGNPCVGDCWCEVQLGAEGRFLSNEESIIEQEYYYTVTRWGHYFPRPNLDYPPIHQLNDVNTGGILDIDLSTDHVYLPAEQMNPGISLFLSVKVETRYKARVRLNIISGIYEFIGNCEKYPEPL
ncbi:MAG: hypothetical protein IH851_07955 [Armatimonadetes bacterium]|nr:hypothetical protein [Armatimonadota bacterium]